MLTRVTLFSTSTVTISDPLEEALTYATAAAVTSLHNADASEGVLPLGEALELLKTFPRAAIR